MEVVLAQAARSQAMHGRRINGTTKWGGRTKADVINQHNNDIRCTFWRLDAEQRRRLDTANVELFELGGIRFRNGDLRAQG